MSRFNRRRFLRTAAGTAGAVAAFAPFGVQTFAQDRRIRLFWWGNPDRDERTFRVIEIFNEKHPDIEVVGEALGFSDYFTRLTTQIAGGNMADIIQQGYGVLFEYIDRGAVVPLDDYVGSTLDISNMDESGIQAGTVDGRFYALSIGANSHMAIYNTRLYEEAGVEFDPFAWTYDDVERIGAQITEATGVFGTDDNTANYQNFSDYVHQVGEEMYDAEGRYGVSQDTVESYWEIWTRIRNAGATPPGPVSAGLVDAEMSQWGIVTGQTATSYAWSNQLVGAQALVQDRLGAAMYPNTPAMTPGSIIQPSQFLCLSRDSADPEAATQFMSAFVNDPDMTAVLGLERGIPENSAVRDMLEPTLEGAEAESVAFFDGIQGRTMDLPPPPPPGANEIEQAFERIAVNILLDQRSISDVAAEFLQEAETIQQRQG